MLPTATTIHPKDVPRGRLRWLLLGLSMASTGMLMLFASNLGDWRTAWDQTPGPARTVTKLVISPVWQFGAPLAALGLLAWLWTARPRPLRYYVGVLAAITFALWLTYTGRTGDVVQGG